VGRITRTANAADTFVRDWIRAHARDCERTLNKPLIISEYGRQRQPASLFGSPFRALPRDHLRFYEVVHSEIRRNSRRGGAINGGMFWVWTHESSTHKPQTRPKP
jgi:hypothetical protein